MLYSHQTFLFAPVGGRSDFLLRPFWLPISVARRLTRNSEVIPFCFSLCTLLSLVDNSTKQRFAKTARSGFHGHVQQRAATLVVAALMSSFSSIYDRCRSRSRRRRLDTQIFEFIIFASSPSTVNSTRNRISLHTKSLFLSLCSTCFSLPPMTFTSASALSTFFPTSCAITCCR